MINAVSFLHGVNAGNAGELDVLGRWQHSDTTKSLAVPIGVTEGGETFCLNIATHTSEGGGIGPHGMIAGAEGSGKTELLKTLLLSLAVNFSPDDVNFVILDTKSDNGELFSLLKDIPHLAGRCCANDSLEAVRFMKSLRAEALRRKTVFDNMQDSIGHYIEEYYKYRRKFPEAGLEPMPHLVVVIDDFAEFVSQMFAQHYENVYGELDFIMWCGLFVGIHVILATSQYWSLRERLRIYFRICMRTDKPLESRSVIGIDDAFSLSSPGEAYITCSLDSTKPVRLRTFYTSSPAPANSSQTEGSLIVREVIRTAEANNFASALPFFT